MPDLRVKSADGTVSARVTILKQQVGVTAIDLWQDTDHNGAPDKYLCRLTKPGQNENEAVVLGEPSDLNGKVVQWVWMPSQPPQTTDGWAVELDVTQLGQSVAGMPLRLSGEYAKGKRYGLFETWFRLVAV